MLLQANSSLEERIIEFLAKRPFQTAQQIHQAINHGHRKCSIQAVFKELSKLTKQGVLVHERPRYAISLPWGNELAQLVRTVEQSAIRPEFLEYYLPAGKSKRSWKFRDLFQLKNFWSQSVPAITG